jgi:hypothetical protein
MLQVLEIGPWKTSSAEKASRMNFFPTLYLHNESTYDTGARARGNGITIFATLRYIAI